MTITEILKKREFLQKQKDEALVIYKNVSEQLDMFEIYHKEELQKYDNEKLETERQKEKERENRKNDINTKIFTYLKVGMWVCVKTNSGKEWQQVTGKNISRFDVKYNTVTCSRPRKGYNPIKLYGQVDGDVVYKTSPFEFEHIARSDNYVMNSIKDVLVPIGYGFYVSKSFRKGFF